MMVMSELDQYRRSTSVLIHLLLRQARIPRTNRTLFMPTLRPITQPRSAGRTPIRASGEYW